VDHVTPKSRPKGVRPERASVLVGEHRLDLEFDPDFLTDQETARLERLVHRTSKSSRLKVVVAVNPERTFPQGSMLMPANSMWRLTGRVTSRIVSSPRTSYRPLPLGPRRDPGTTTLDSARRPGSPEIVGARRE
jgi:hypothetical protein